LIASTIRPTAKRRGPAVGKLRRTPLSNRITLRRHEALGAIITRSRRTTLRAAKCRARAIRRAKALVALATTPIIRCANATGRRGRRDLRRRDLALRLLLLLFRPSAE
jgi:hypothetical protein